MKRLLLIAALSCCLLAPATGTFAATLTKAYTLDGKAVSGDVITNNGRTSTWSFSRLFGHHFHRPLQFKANTGCLGKPTCHTFSRNLTMSHGGGRNAKANSSFANLN